MNSNGKILRIKLLRDVKSQKGLFLATSFILFLGIMLFCSFYLSYLNLNDTYESFYDSSNFEDISVKVTKLTSEDIKRIKRLDGILDLQARIVTSGTVVIGDQEIPAKIISLPENERINRLYIAEGEKGFAVIKKFADYYGLTTNTFLTVKFADREYKEKISALVYSAEFILIIEDKEESFITSPGSYAIVYIPEKDLLSAGLQMNEIKVKVSDEGRKEEILGKILYILGDRVEEFYTGDKQISRRLLQEDLDGFRTLAVLFPAFFLLIATFSTYTLLSRIVRLQLGNIAVMRALGFTRSEILRHYMYYPALIGFVSTISGIAVGLIMSQILTSQYISFLNLPYYISKPHEEVLFFSFIIGILTPFISGLIVARNASNVDIVKSLRGYAEEVFSGGVILTLTDLISKILRLRLVFSLALRNVVRNKKRSSFSIFSIVACISLIINSMVFIDSFEYVIDLQFEKVYAYDIKISLRGYDDGEILDQIRELDGVLQAEPIIETSIAVEKGGVVSSTALIASEFQSLYNIYNAKGEKLIPTDGIIFPKTAMKNLSLVNGEKVTLYTEFGKIEGKVEALEEIPLTPVALTSLEYFKKMTGVRGYNTIVVNADDDKIDEVVEKTKTIKGVRKVSTIREAKESIMDLMDFFYAFVTFSLLFGVSLGFAAIFNTTSISIIERSRELATLRMMGYTSKEIAVSLILEYFALGVIGTMIGLPFAYGSAYLFFSSFESELYFLPMILYPRTYIFTTVAVFAVILLALVPSIRYISRMDIAKVTKELVS